MSYYQLWWNSEDGQTEHTAGEFASKEEALASVEDAMQWFVDQAAGDVEMEDEMRAGDFYVTYVGPEIVVEDVSVEDNGGDLFASFTVRKIGTDGEEIAFNVGEWIDLDDGLLVGGQDSNMDHWPDGLSDDDLALVEGIVTDRLRENPISDDILETYREALEARHEANLEEASSLGM